MYFELDTAETAPLPGVLSTLVGFDALLVLRCLRPDRAPLGVARFVASVLGERYIHPPVLDMSAVFRQSSEMTPVVFVLSPGADPAFDIFKCVAYRPMLTDVAPLCNCFVLPAAL
jgi:dynein heavy chain, axonemal